MEKILGGNLLYNIRVNLEDITRNGILLRRKKFMIKIYFYPSAWKWTNYLEITEKRNVFHSVGFPCSEMVLKEALRKVLKEDRESKTFWVILNLLNELSFYTRGKKLEAYLKRRDISSVLKGVWLSMILAKYETSLRRKIRREVRKLVKAGEVSGKNRFVKKILTVEKYILWKKVFSKGWDNIH